MLPASCIHSYYSNCIPATHARNKRILHYQTDPKSRWHTWAVVQRAAFLCNWPQSDSTRCCTETGNSARLDSIRGKVEPYDRSRLRRQRCSWCRGGSRSLVRRGSPWFCDAGDEGRRWFYVARSQGWIGGLDRHGASPRLLGVSDWYCGTWAKGTTARLNLSSFSFGGGRGRG